MLRPVVSIPLPSSAHSRLVRSGYRSLADFSECQSPPGLPPPADPPSVRSAWTLVCQLHDQPHFLTHLPALDALLGSRGLPLAAVCELVACPSSAIADLCLHLCAAIQMPPRQMSAVYIDSTGSFSRQAALSAADSFCRQHPDIHSDIDPSTMLANIHRLRVYSAHELLALLGSFDRVCQRLSNVGLLVVNSISWPFLATLPDDIFRRQSLHAEAARLLTQIASNHNISVVVVSQAKSALPGGDGPPLPMDGSAWTRIASNSIAIRGSGGSLDQTSFSLIHSVANPTGTADP
ncbi:DNA repair protein rad51c, partial [Coemansia sp. RSA 2611]